MEVNLFILLVYLIPILLFTFFVRALFRLTHKHSTGGDVWWHMHASEEIRKNGHRMPAKLERYSIDTVFDNPPLYPWLFSYMSRERRERIEWALGPIADSILVFIIFIFLVITFEDYLIAFVGGLMFSLTPILIKPDARTFFFSPRPYGELFAVLSILCSLLFVIRSDYLLFAGAVILSSMVLLTGKFPTQALFFSYVGFSIFYLTSWFLVILLMGFALAVLISRGFYLKTIRAHIRHSRFYRRTIVFRHSWTKSVTGFREFREAFSRDPNRTSKRTTILVRNPIMNALVFTPFLPFLWLLTAFSWDTIWGSKLLASMFVWANLMFILVLIVSLRQLKFLGEAERYEGFGVIPLCVLVPVLLISLNSPGFWFFFAFVIAYSVILIAINYRVSTFYFGVSEQEKEMSDEFFRFLQTLPPARILCVPANISPEVTFKSKHSTLYWGGSLPGGDFGHDEFNEVFEEFPNPTRQLRSTAKKYGMNLIVFSKKGAGEDLDEERYDLNGFEPIFRNGRYSIYRAEEAGSE